MKLISVVALFIICILACSSARKATPSPIRVVTLHNYELNSTVTFNEDIHYTFITNAEDFRKMFHMTKASPGTATVPDFASQSVVAIILKPTEKVVSADINKAEIAGEDLNIYYTITDTTSWKNYLHTPKAVAIIAKSVSVKRVNFYSNKIKEKTLQVNQ